MAEKIAKKGRGGAREGAGRPKIELDPAQAEKLGEILPSLRDLAAHFGVAAETVDARLSDSPEFAKAFARGQARARVRLSGTQLEQACGYWFCPACNRPLRVPDPTPDDPERVKPCPDHPPESFPELKEGGFRRPWRRWRGGNPISGIWLGKQHLGQADRSFIEQDFQRDMSKIPEGRLLDLVFEALRVLGKAAPADLVAEIQKRSKP